ncbi:peptidylprolyl isomerase [Sphingobium aquiterrae]|uniref:peptidylprolyl isomerase n=1 Tax=Sphingobium aquiterrae TaxID=2038656 RepID=UPI00301AA539
MISAHSRRRLRHALASVIAAIVLPAVAPLGAQAPAKPSRTPADIIAAAPAAAWRDIAPEDILVMTLAGDRQVIVQLAPHFSRAHVASMRALATAHWWDGTSVYRVQDNYVAQWGDVTEKKPLPAGMPASLPEDYGQPARALPPVVPAASVDAFAKVTGFLDGWPVAGDGSNWWPTHCYGAVGVARNLRPDAGSGAELYAVIGHAPRALDRNIALVGRVIEGIAFLSSLPRGSGNMGFYGKEQQPTPILSVRLASELPLAEQPHFQMFDTGSATFAAYTERMRHRDDDFFTVAAEGADICSIKVPVRRTPAA